MSLRMAVGCVKSHNRLHQQQQQLRDICGNYDMKGKCGEIFFHKTATDLTITLRCVTCKLICNKLEDFVEHIKSSECNNEKNEKKYEDNMQSIFINKNYNSDTEEFKDQETNVIQNLSEKMATLCDSNILSSMAYNNIYNNESTSTACDDYSEQSINTLSEYRSTSDDTESVISLAFKNNSLYEHCPKIVMPKCNTHLHGYRHDNKSGTFMKSNVSGNIIIKNANECCLDKIQSRNCINDLNDKSFGRCNGCICSMSSLNDYCCSISKCVYENILDCKICGRYFQKQYQLKIHKMIAHKMFPRIIGSNTKLSCYSKNVYDDDSMYSDGGQMIGPSIKNTYRKQKKNLTVKFLEPIMLNGNKME